MTPQARRPPGRPAVLIFALAALLPAVARAATEVKLDRDFLAGVVEKLPPTPFEQAGKYKGTVHSFRLAGIDPARRALLAAFTVDGAFQPPASGPLSERMARADGHVQGLRKFAFEVKAAVNVEPRADGVPRFKVDVDEVKRTELEGVAGLLANMLGRQFDRIVTQVVDGRADDVGRKLNEMVVKKMAAYKDYGVLCGIEYAADSVALRFDLTRFNREGIVGHVFGEPRPGATPLYRWRDEHGGGHLYTLSPSPPPGRIVAEGIACYVPDASAPGVVPVSAWHGRTDHFYTPGAESVPPRAYRAEGVAFHVLAGPTDGSTPFYRFFDPRRSLHFYTTHPHAEFAK